MGFAGKKGPHVGGPLVAARQLLQFGRLKAMYSPE